MSNDNTQLYRIELNHPDGQIECHPCLRRDQFGDLLAPIGHQAVVAEGTMIEIFDYQSWRPGLTNKSLIRLKAV